MYDESRTSLISFWIRVFTGYFTSFTSLTCEKHWGNDQGMSWLDGVPSASMRQWQRNPDMLHDLPHSEGPRRLGLLWMPLSPSSLWKWFRLPRQGFQVFSTWTHHWKPKTAPAKPARKKKKHPILSVQCQAHIRFAYNFKKHIFDTWCVPSPSTSKAKSLEGNGEMFPLVASACKTKTRFAHMRIELI